MFDTQKFIKNRKVEKFENFKFQYDSEFYTNENMVIFFDLEINYTVNQYITSNLEILKQRFSEEYMKFMYLPSVNYSQINNDILNFYVPHLDTNTFNRSMLENEFEKVFSDNPLISYKTDYENILDYFGYNGSIKCGFIFITEYTALAIECADLILQNDQESFFADLLLYLRAVSEQIFGNFDESIDNNEIFNPYKNLDEDALAKINEIQNQLSELKQNGQLLFALPIIKEILEKETNTINFNSENNLLIDKDFRILLPNFNNIEIQLSHLTKAVYTLFYNNPQGINIKWLPAHKQEIIFLYTGISNQLDYDKMLQSIDDLVKPDSKAIYTHISRIKAAFYKQMDYKFADKFIVTSTSFGNDFKFIPILKDKIDIRGERHDIVFDL